MKVGLIGYGVMGRNHYRVLKSLRDIEDVVVCDSQCSCENCEVKYSEYIELLENESLDAVLVCVPTSSHLKVASEVLKRKIPVLIEKPIASNVNEAKKLIELSKRYNTPAVVGHVERFNPVVRSLMSELEGKEIYSINITRIGPFPPRINDVGVLVDLSVHDIDLVNCFTGFASIREARVYKSQKLIGNREDNAVITIKFENDIIANITTNWLTPFKKRTIEVATGKAFYSADLMSQELTEFSNYTENNSYLIRNCYVQKGEPLIGELKAFVEFVRSGEEGGLATLRDGLLALETIYRKRGYVS